MDKFLSTLQSLEKLQGRTLIVTDTQISLKQCCTIGKGSLYAKTSSIHAVVSTQYWLVTEGYMDRHRHKDNTALAWQCTGKDVS